MLLAVLALSFCLNKSEEQKECRPAGRHDFKRLEALIESSWPVGHDTALVFLQENELGASLFRYPVSVRRSGAP